MSDNKYPENKNTQKPLDKTKGDIANKPRMPGQQGQGNLQQKKPGQALPGQSTNKPFGGDKSSSGINNQTKTPNKDDKGGRW